MAKGEIEQKSDLANLVMTQSPSHSIINLHMSMTRLIPLLGMAVILATATLLSKNRKAIPWRTVGVGLGLQILVALFVLRTGLGYNLMTKVSGFFVSILNCSFAGSEFVFGDLGKHQSSFGFVFAFQALPMIIFVAALMSIL